MDLQTVLSEVGSWSVEDRIRLVQEVWEGIADDPSVAPGLTDELKAEVDRRLAAHAADPGAAVPWEIVEAEALARLAR